MIERHKHILQVVNNKGTCSYQELSDQLGVSTMTIRRDVELLAGQGLVIKILGGVQTKTASTYLYESPVLARLGEHAEEKQAIARKAMELIRPGMTVYLDGGTTCIELAKQIASELEGLTIVTNSAIACMELAKNSANMIVSIGGQLDTSSLCFVGPSAEDQTERFFVDLAFISTKGFIPTEGTFESSIATIRIKQVIVRQAAAVALLVDHSKFGLRALTRVLDVSQIHHVVTDAGIDAQRRKELQDAPFELLLADAARAEIRRETCDSQSRR